MIEVLTFTLPFWLLLLYKCLKKPVEPITVRGRVLDDDDKPIQGVSIDIRGQGQPVLTDENGCCLIKICLSDSAGEFRWAKVSKLGYEPLYRDYFFSKNTSWIYFKLTLEKMLKAPMTLGENGQ